MRRQMKSLKWRKNLEKRNDRVYTGKSLLELTARPVTSSKINKTVTLNIVTAHDSFSSSHNSSKNFRNLGTLRSLIYCDVPPVWQCQLLFCAIHEIYL